MDTTMQRIVAELKIQGKKQTELADFLGITSNVITDWKSGRIKSYSKYLYGIANFLNVSVEYLKGETDKKEKPLGIREHTIFNFEGEPGAQKIEVNLNNLEQISKLVRELRDMPPDKIEAVTEFVKKIK